jgi:hypothetical protein
MGRRKGSKTGKKPETVEQPLNEQPLNTPDQHIKECAICLEHIKWCERFTLPCGHVFHGKCCKQWAFSKNEDNTLDMVQPVKNRKIMYFKLNRNNFNCPICRVEYYRDPWDGFKIKKVLAKIHSTFNGERFVNYINDALEMSAYVPSSEINRDNTPSVKWNFYISMLSNIWKRTDDNNIYPVKRLHPVPEFLLRTDFIMWRPMTKDAKIDEENNKDCNHLFELVEIEDLGAVLNNM